MSTPLNRIPLDAAPGPDALRDWAKQRVMQSVTTKGHVPPEVLIPYGERADLLDLERVLREQPGVDVAATFRQLADAAGGPAFLVMPMQGQSSDGDTIMIALVLEDRPGPDGGRQWWSSMLPFDADPRTGVGRPTQAWEDCAGATDNPRALPEWARDLVGPSPDARAARIGPPDETSLDIRMRFGDLPANVKAPEDCVGLVHLTRALSEPQLLDGSLSGHVVVKLIGRSWELFQLSGPMPADLTTMARYLANRMEPVADGLAMTAIVIDPERGPDPAVQIVAQLGGQITETWLPLAFPEGPETRPVAASEMLLRSPRPIMDQDRWIGVDPGVDWELPVMSVGEA